jgi:hypothetical protein
MARSTRARIQATTVDEDRALWRSPTAATLVRTAWRSPGLDAGNVSRLR